LKQVQDDQGFISRTALEDLAGRLGLGLGQVFGVASFYSFLDTAPRGRHVIRVCAGLPCVLGDSRVVLEILGRELDLAPGGTTPDQRFSLEICSCLGICDQAPAMMIDDDVYGHLTSERIAEVLRRYE
jgi:NADH:ubiquinone oxidoreductase subunit E